MTSENVVQVVHIGGGGGGGVGIWTKSIRTAVFFRETVPKGINPESQKPRRRVGWKVCAHWNVFAVIYKIDHKIKPEHDYAIFH